jgi:hypothetical protein
MCDEFFYHAKQHKVVNRRPTALAQLAIVVHEQRAMLQNKHNDNNTRQQIMSKYITD